MTAPRALVLGGGIAGLTAAYRLGQDGFDVRLLEASGEAGGATGTEKADGFLLERGADCFLTAKPDAVELCEELGLGGRLIGTIESNRRSLVVSGGKLKPVPEGFYLLAPSSLGALFSADLFSWGGRLRMAMDLFIRRRTDGADESLAEFVRRRFGQEALDRLAQPMVAGITTADPETLSLRAVMPQFADMEKEHRSIIKALGRRKLAPGTSGPRYGMFASLDGGMGLLVQALAAALPGRIELNARVTGLVTDGSLWTAITTRGEFRAENLVVALPARAAGPLLQPIDHALASLLDRIPFASVATAYLGFREEEAALPEAMGFVVPSIENRFTLACSFTSRKFPGRAREGQALVRAFVGGAMQPGNAELPDEEIVARVRKDLMDLHRIGATPSFSRVYRAPASMPQYKVGHLELAGEIDAAAARLPRLALTGNSYWGVGIPDTIRSAGRAAGRIAKMSLRKSAPTA